VPHDSGATLPRAYNQTTQLRSGQAQAQQPDIAKVENVDSNGVTRCWPLLG